LYSATKPKIRNRGARYDTVRLPRPSSGKQMSLESIEERKAGRVLAVMTLTGY